jgi:hypothetical protein
MLSNRKSGYDEDTVDFLVQVLRLRPQQIEERDSWYPYNICVRCSTLEFTSPNAPFVELLTNCVVCHDCMTVIEQHRLKRETELYMFLAKIKYEKYFDVLVQNEIDYETLRNGLVAEV